LTCWVFYKYKDQLSGTMAMKFTGDTYAEIEQDAKEWVGSRDDIEVIDVAETVYENIEEENN